ncbi:hypothetical protein EXIGLDRAFT_728362 [Exidia glandulosa HHB12029]|uniref:Uncharacterized protein n=1 Tax=Exidia glandulosa HHB12029 TaxID=1314781 RepID=A0A166B6Q1_EXIGL|nr:hypothetical protein EXIGLDRAFT_728362 [Exidia glandulosa HHB12029]
MSCMKHRLTGTTMDFAEPGRESLDTPSLPVTQTAATSLHLTVQSSTARSAWGLKWPFNAIARAASRVQTTVTKRHRDPSSDGSDSAEDTLPAPLEFEEQDQQNDDGELGPQFTDVLCESPTSEHAFSFTKVNCDGDSVVSSIKPASSRPRRPAVSPPSLYEDEGEPAEEDEPDDELEGESVQSRSAPIRGDVLALQCGRRGRRQTLHIPLVPPLERQPNDRHKERLVGLYREWGWHEPELYTLDDVDEDTNRWSAATVNPEIRMFGRLSSSSLNTDAGAGPRI